MALTTGDEGVVRSDLIERARRGDREDFDVLMLDAIPRLYPIARMIAQDPDIDALFRTGMPAASLRYLGWASRSLPGSPGSLPIASIPANIEAASSVESLFSAANHVS